jgi:hypothetical protein
MGFSEPVFPLEVSQGLQKLDELFNTNAVAVVLHEMYKQTTEAPLARRFSPNRKAGERT